MEHVYLQEKVIYQEKGLKGNEEQMSLPSCLSNILQEHRSVNRLISKLLPICLQGLVGSTFRPMSHRAYALPREKDLAEPEQTVLNYTSGTVVKT